MSKQRKQAALSDALKAAIAESGLTVYAVAQGSGVAHPILSRFLSGQRDLRLATADKLAAFFQMKLTPPKTPKVK
jgi:plasmid maintenance system antidote protein VapI